MEKSESTITLMGSLSEIVFKLREIPNRQDYYLRHLKNLYSGQIENQITNIIQYTIADDLSWFYNELIQRHDCIENSIDILMKLPLSTSKDEDLRSLIDCLSSILELHQLQENLTQLTKLEYKGDYESSIYKKLIDVIMESIKESRTKTQTYHLIPENALQFLKSLSEKEIGQLMVEYYTKNYNRNQGIYFDLLSQGTITTFTSTIFVGTMFSLHKEFRNFDGNRMLARFRPIYQTEFYQENFPKEIYKIKK